MLPRSIRAAGRLVATTLLLALAACPEDAAMPDGRDPEGAGGAGGAGAEAPADPLGLAQCEEAPAPFGEPASLPSIDWQVPDDTALMCSLRTLDAVVEPAKVICLGENSHGVSESSRWHAAVVRYLVHRWNAREISLEIPSASVDHWERFVNDGDPADLEAGFDTQGTLADTVEMELEIQALRNIRLELGQSASLRVSGFDIAIQSQLTIDHLLGFLQQVDPGQTAAAQSSLTTGSYDSRAEAADGLALRIEQNATEYAAATTAAAVELGVRDARNLADGFRFVAIYNKGQYDVANKLHREPGLIRNLTTRIGRLAEGERLVVISHNGHCGRAMSASQNPSEYLDYPSLGAHFSSALGSELVVIGQVYGDGQQLLIDHSTNPINPSIGYLEFLLNGNISGDVALFSTNATFVDLTNEYDMWNIDPIVPAEQFDAMLYVRTVSPTTLR
jgi:erythromycin esterase-like protein